MSTPEAQDRQRVRRAALSVGVWVAAASALVIAVGVGALVVVILTRSRIEGDEHGRFGGAHPGRDGDELVVDVDRVLPWILGLGVAGVIVLSAVAWFAARRAVRPLEEALRLQRHFVADASHELRTPLTTLTSRIQIAQHRWERGGDVAGALEQLRHDADTMNDVLTDLLVAAEGRHATLEPTPLTTGLDAAVMVIAPLAEDAGVSVVAGESAEIVRMPRAALVRVLVAIFDNAIQHSPTGGTVAVTPAVRDRTLEVRVHDQGPGISGEQVDRVFERFARGPEAGRRRGFGLGLALVRETVTRYGGRVEVEDTSPAGTTFLLVLPLAAA